MALTRAQMQLVGSGGAGKVWTYYTADAVATVQAANYFLTMYSDLVAGDFILCRCVVGGTEASFIGCINLSTSASVTMLKSATFT